MDRQSRLSRYASPRGHGADDGEFHTFHRAQARAAHGRGRVMRAALVLVVSSFVPVGCVGFHNAAPVPLAALSSSELVLTYEKLYPNGRDPVVGRNGAAVAIHTGPGCPAVSGDVTATINGAPLPLVTRGGEKVRGDVLPFVVTPACEWLVFQHRVHRGPSPTMGTSVSPKTVHASRRSASSPLSSDDRGPRP